LAEQVVFDQQDAVKLPDGISFEEGACLPCAGVTAWNSLIVAGDMKCGQSVLTLGTGGVSVFAIQFAKAAGCLSIATSSSDAKLAKAKALGADVLINYKTTPDWDKKVREVTGGRGVDHVVEIGGVGTLERSYRSLANEGCIGLIGFLASADNNPVIGLGRGAKVQRINVGSRRSFEDMNRAIAVNKIKPVIDKVFPFEQAPAAYEYEMSGAHFGKIVVTI
jgi:NADPH:quinone reductase-like Zn-dependent oxidoreductase